MTTMQAGANGNHPGTAIKPKSEGQAFAEWIMGRKDALAAVLPKHLTAERMCKIVIGASIKTPLILRCTRESVWMSVFNAAQLGLDCGGALGEAYLLPFKDHKSGQYICQLIIGYRGMISLARRSGEIESIEAVPVYKGETFTFIRGLETKIEHPWSPETDTDVKNLIAVYMIARFKGGGHYFLPMSLKEVNLVRGRSKAASSGPWVTDFTAMALKTVIRKGFKFLPVSTEVVNRIEAVAERSPDIAADIMDVQSTEVVDTTTGEIGEDNGGSSDVDETPQLPEGQGNTAPPLVTPQSKLAETVTRRRGTTGKPADGVSSGDIDAAFGG